MSDSGVALTSGQVSGAALSTSSELSLERICQVVNGKVFPLKVILKEPHNAASFIRRFFSLDGTSELTDWHLKTFQKLSPNTLPKNVELKDLQTKELKKGTPIEVGYTSFGVALQKKSGEELLARCSKILAAPVPDSDTLLYQAKVEALKKNLELFVGTLEERKQNLTILQEHARFHSEQLLREETSKSHLASRTTYEKIVSLCKRDWENKNDSAIGKILNGNALTILDSAEPLLFNLLTGDKFSNRLAQSALAEVFKRDFEPDLVARRAERLLKQADTLNSPSDEHNNLLKLPENAAIRAKFDILTSALLSVLSQPKSEDTLRRLLINPEVQALVKLEPVLGKLVEGIKTFTKDPNAALPLFTSILLELSNSEILPERKAAFRQLATVGALTSVFSAGLSSQKKQHHILNIINCLPEDALAEKASSYRALLAYRYKLNLPGLNTSITNTLGSAIGVRAETPDITKDPFYTQTKQAVESSLVVLGQTATDAKIAATSILLNDKQNAKNETVFNNIATAIAGQQLIETIAAAWGIVPKSGGIAGQGLAGKALRATTQRGSLTVSFAKISPKTKPAEPGDSLEGVIKITNNLVTKAVEATLNKDANLLGDIITMQSRGTLQPMGRKFTHDAVKTGSAFIITPPFIGTNTFSDQPYKAPPSPDETSPAVRILKPLALPNQFGPSPTLFFPEIAREPKGPAQGFPVTNQVTENKIVVASKNIPIAHDIDLKSNLTSEQISNVQQFAGQWLLQTYENGLTASKYTPTAWFSRNPINKRFSEIVSTEQLHATGEYNRKDMACVVIFLESLLKFIEEKSAIPGEAHRLNSYLADLSKAGFSSSSTLTQMLPPVEHLILTSKLNSNPFLQKTLGGPLVIEAVFKTDGLVEDPRLASILKSKSPEVVLNILDQLETILVKSLSYQLNQPDPEKLIGLLDSIKLELDTPLVGYQIAQTVTAVRDAQSLPSFGYAYRLGDPSGARLARNLDEEFTKNNQLLSAAVYVSGQDQNGQRLAKIASDMIGVLDHSGVPQSIGAFDSANINFLGNPELAQLQNIHRLLSSDIAPPLLIPELQKIVQQIDLEPVKRQMLASGVSTSLVEQFQQATKDVLKVDRFPNSTFDQRSIDYLEEYQKLAPIIRRQLKESIGQVLQTEIESRPKVEVQSVADLNDNKRYFPFGVPDGRNMGLLFQRMHSPEIKSHLEQDLNIKLEDIPFRSQLHLLSYLCEQNHSAFKRLREVLKKHPNDATTILTTFLSYSEGQNFVEPILVIAENIPQKNALFIFKKYADIAKEVDTIRSFIRKNFDGVTATEEKVNTVAGNLIRQANQLLLEAGQVVRAGNPNEIDVILKKFDRAKGEVSLFASVYKLLAKEVAASLLSLPGVTLSKVSAKELSSEEVGQVSAISLENCRAQYPEAYAKIVHENFIKSLSDSTTNLYLLRVESQIVSFLRSSPTEKTNTIYLGSFNTDSLLKGSGLGFPLFQEVLRLEGGKTVRAVSHPKNPNLEKYLESYGFKIVGQQDKGDGIEKSVVIERPAEVK
jgi:hypothetical protein